jgi:signal peptidase I
VPEPPSTRRRRVAAVLNFVFPGVGYLYAGLLRSALLAFALVPLTDVVAVLLFVLVPLDRANVAVPLLWMLAVRIFVAGDAARACSDAAARPDRWHARWYACAAAALLVSFAINPLTAVAIRATVVRAYSFPTGSMEDTILNGDHVLVSRWDYRLHAPRRGDMVVFPYPEDPSRTFLKRVIGLPGETVEIRNRSVVIDGRMLAEPYARFIVPDGFDAHGRDWGPRLLPAKSYFVLGDNRDNSKDSRYWGYVREGDFGGRARMVYWSVEPDTHAIRWGRIGRRFGN